MPTPRDYTKELIELANAYAAAGEELARIQIEKSSAVLILMADSKSFKEAELRWQSSENGKKELILVYKMRGLKEIISAAKVRIRTMNDEKHNYY